MENNIQINFQNKIQEFIIKYENKQQVLNCLIVTMYFYYGNNLKNMYKINRDIPKEIKQVEKYLELQNYLNYFFNKENNSFINIAIKITIVHETYLNIMKKRKESDSIIRGIYIQALDNSIFI